MKISWHPDALKAIAGMAVLATLTALAGCQSAPVRRPGQVRQGVPASGARLPAAQIESELVQEQAELAGALQNSGVTLVRSGAQLRLTLPVWQLFSADALELKVDVNVIAPLPQLIAVLRAHPAARLEIRVFTDSIGGAVVNRALSQRRGQALLAAFDAAGIDPSRLRVFAVGDSSPVAGNDTPEGRRRNRRIELTLLPE